jgi:hypothetical protein
MKQRVRTSGALGMVGVLVALVIGPAQSASAATTATYCPPTTLFQPFSGDSRWYTMTPGEAPDAFAGTGWLLTGGAKITTQTLADGSTGTVLDLPAGSTALSPPMCVDSTYPLARMETRTLGKAPDNSTKFFTERVGSSTLSGGIPVLGTTSWAASPPDNVAGAGAGAAQVQFKFVAGNKAADLQVYNLWIDPRMHY